MAKKIRVINFWKQIFLVNINEKDVVHKTRLATKANLGNTSLDIKKHFIIWIFKNKSKELGKRKTNSLDENKMLNHEEQKSNLNSRVLSDAFKFLCFATRKKETK